jgi:TonB family protein
MLLLLLLAVAPAPALAQTTPDVQNPSTVVLSKWERFTYPDEEFSVELPETPFVFDTTRRVSRTLSESEKMRVYGVYSGGVIFMLVSYDKPRDGETFDDFAGYTQGGSLGSLNSKGSITLKGFAGKEYELPFGLVVARVFRAKERAYLLRAYTRTANDPRIAHFLNSFSLKSDNSGSAAEEFKSEAARVARVPLPERLDPSSSGGIGPGMGIGRGENSGIGPGRGSSSGPGVGPGYEGGGGPGNVGSVDYTRTFRQNEVTRRARIVYKAEPSYTEEARRNNVKGVVRLRAVLSANGKVTDISIVKSLPDGLTERAILAARHMLFFPAGKDGRDVSQFVVLEYNFSIY